MPDLIVLVPTRGRPHSAQEMLELWPQVTTAADLRFLVDDDDPTLTEYQAVPGIDLQVLPPGGGMIPTLNRAAREVAEQGEYRSIGFLGDDHRPRTVGWDDQVAEHMEALAWTGFVYGDDLSGGDLIPTHVFTASSIVRKLGYMAPSPLRHAYLDHWSLVMGHSCDNIRFLKTMVIEHVHPYAGKGTWDEHYERVNNHDLLLEDRWIWQSYLLNGRFADDVSAVLELLP